MEHTRQVKNLKELRIQHQGRPYRVFFAFDPKRNAVLLCGGNKTGKKRFYDMMVPIAEQEFLNHLSLID
ncbi:type II toxin-antitoxin system RelE/ParE family toxin [Legionella adelaidensis]|uniref:type II toxin-antitoxin system RelE/ParE family toxin n=1 Tax=Legionella adelaidensis TaxID=45056 RepID=UPI002F94C8B6